MKYFYVKKLNNNVEIKDYFLTQHKPSWFSNLCPFKNKKRNVVDAYKELNNKWDLIYKTIKICPGINHLFNNSIALKFPCDLIVETTKEGKWFFNRPSDLISVESHDSHQYEDSGPLKDYIVLKFSLPILFQAPKNKVIFIDPIYFNQQPYKVLPGVINFNNHNPLTLSVIVTFNKENKIYYFKHNEIMALMFFNEQVQLQEKEIKQIQAKTFLGNWFNENFK